VALWFGEQHGLTTPGRLDRLLGPYYEADLAAGRTTPERAQELIDCLYVLMNEYCPRGLAISVMVGGRDAAGRDHTNDVSLMCVQGLLNTRLNYPTVGVCWHPGAPERLVALGLKALAAGRGSPAFFNDDLIAAGLRDLGVSREDSFLYQNSTCVEIAPIGTSNVWVATPYFNVVQPLLDEIKAAAEGHVQAPADFDEFKRRVFDRLGSTVATAGQRNSEMWLGRERWLGYPLLSCFTRDCLERGADIDGGGARYNWVENSFVGTANLVDSLAAVRELVYRRKRLTLAQLHAVLAADFSGHEGLRQEILGRLPKYGNDDDDVDGLAVEATRFYVETCRPLRIAGRHPFVPGMFCWVKHVSLGQETGATPDGRPAHVALADGAGPAQGRERCGPTAAVKSVTKWNHRPILGGVVLNLKFNPRLLADEEGRRKVGQLLATYLRLGGFEAQVNVVSRETLRKAQERPEEYRDLLVRIAGYSDYFVGLSRGRQEEVIARTEFAEA
jgi:formate C-acetyltransferase